MRKKINCILLILILMFSLLTINSYAVDLSFTTTMTPSSTSVSESTEVVITVAVSNLNVGDSGINAFSAYLSYDSDVFETLTDSSVEGLNSWTSTYSTTSGQILLTKNSFVNDDENIMQITLKTKEGVTSGTDGTVSLTGIVAQNSESTIDGSNVSTTITVGTESTSTTNTANAITIIANTTSTNTTNATNNANTSNSANTNTNTNTNNTSTSTYNVTNTSSDDSIPYTGVSTDALIKIILGVILIALAIYIKLRKMDELN